MEYPKIVVTSKEEEGVRKVNLNDLPVVSLDKSLPVRGGGELKGRSWFLGTITDMKTYGEKYEIVVDSLNAVCLLKIKTPKGSM
jgi:hypothetical protein